MSNHSSILDGTTVLLAGTEEWIPAFAECLRAETGAAVETAPDAEGVLDRLEAGGLACVVSSQELGGASGLELLTDVREAEPGLPVLLCSADGSERLASEAISRGVADYVPVSDPVADSLSELRRRTAEAVWSAGQRSTQQDRARQFEAVFHDARAATWVLDSDGALTRVNQAAREMISESVETIIGEPFWTLPYWTEPQDTSDDVQRLVRDGLNGEFGNAVVAGSSFARAPRILDLSVHPVADEQGTVVSVVVTGTDVSERVHLERDLRESEQLHRATLKYMTDTVFMTDEAGEYVYVCPNVHFIFGYTAAEIQDSHPVEELLGPELFDRERLAQEGTLKNIECTVTDKAGREHTLLVNVREVAIQDGRLLYTCRDITKRKRREEALQTLQRTGRDFLYAETAYEIAQHLVEDTPGVLNVDASGVYLFDADENALEPASYSPRLERLHGPLSSVQTGADTPASHCFLEDEPLFFEDTRDATAFENPTTELRQVAYLPLGDHGVFMFGTDQAGPFEEITRELADLLATTGEAALDRVSRESLMRRKDRELQQRNQQLSSLNRINETIREIDQALVRSETREEIEHSVCELLTGEDRFSFAWIGAADQQSASVVPSSWAGYEEGYLDSLSFPMEPTGVEPAGRAAVTGEPVTVENVAEELRTEPWRKDAIARDHLSVISVPLTYKELSYGVLTVYADSREEFGATLEAVLLELGETIASAISAVERKNALLSTSMTRLEFSIEDPSFALSRIAQAADATLSYQGGVSQSAEGHDVFVTVEDGDIDDIEAVAAGLVSIESVQTISTEGAETVLRLGFSEGFFALELADHGAVFRSARASPETTTLVIDVPETIEARHVSRLVRETFAGVELVSKQQLDQSAEQDLYSRFLEKLTDRQFEVVQTAYYSGFFESPRGSSGEAVAETLDISSTAFYQHIRTVQLKLFSTLFDEIGVAVTQGD